jgi:lipid II:glycine glycyltransferase (peptidoglycan interpeptide bridge formation enzyme)
MIDHTTKTRVIRFSSPSADDVWAGMEGRSRTAIRKAERAGVEIAEIAGERAVETYYGLHVATYRRTGLAPYPRRFYEVLLSRSWSRFFVAAHQGQPVAALGILVHDGRALYSHSASLPEGQRLGANNLLQWHALRWMAASGFQAYEVGLVPPEIAGPLRKDVAIGRYKRSLGGFDEPSHRGEYLYATRREAVLTAARRLQTVARRMKPALARKN